MKAPASVDDSLIVEISDALSEQDGVKFTVQTRTTLPQFSKSKISVVRRHEEFIWLHDCFEDDDDYAGYIIPPKPPRPDFDASREKLQRLGDAQSNMSKDEFAKMKQELEAEYLAIFKKTVAMHEIFLRRLAVHDKFRYDPNFKIFLEYENELLVRSKNKKEKLTGFIQNIGRSAHDLVITTSQVAASTSTSSIFVGQASSRTKPQVPTSSSIATINQQANQSTIGQPSGSSVNSETKDKNSAIVGNLSEKEKNDVSSKSDEEDEQYFQRERLLLAMYYKSIKEAAANSTRVTQAQKWVADSYLQISQQLIKLSAIEVLQVTEKTTNSFNFLACPLPSLTLPTITEQEHKQVQSEQSETVSQEETHDEQTEVSKQSNILAIPNRDIGFKKNFANCSGINQTSDGLKQFLLCFSDYLEQARKIERRMASNQDLKLTDTLVYYKRDTAAATDLINRRQRFMVEFDTANKNLEKSRQRGKMGQMQYVDVIQDRARENLINISKLARGELADYKQRRVASLKKAFNELVELELQHLRTYAQLTRNCLNACRGLNTTSTDKPKSIPVTQAVAGTSSSSAT